MIIKSDEGFLDFLKIFSINKLSSQWTDVYFDSNCLFKTDNLLSYPINNKQFIFCFYYFYQYSNFNNTIKNLLNSSNNNINIYNSLFYLINTENSQIKKNRKKTLKDQWNIFNLLFLIYSKEAMYEGQDCIGNKKDSKVYILLSIIYYLNRSGNYAASIYFNNITSVFFGSSHPDKILYQKAKDKDLNFDCKKFLLEFSDSSLFNVNLEEYPPHILKLLKKNSQIGLCIYNNICRKYNYNIKQVDEFIKKNTLYNTNQNLKNFKNIIWYYNLVFSIQKIPSNCEEKQESNQQNSTFSVISKDNLKYSGSQNSVEIFKKLSSLKKWSLKHEKTDQLKLLKEKYPWMEKSLDYIINKIITQQSFSNMVLKGKPGCGKTNLIKDINKILDLPYNFYSMAGTSDTMTLIGNAKAWGTSTASLPVLTMANKGISNPCIVIDDFDKHMPHGNNGDGYAALSKFVEPTSAEIFYDESLCTTIDCSQINWIFTCNGTWNLPNILKSRLDIIDIESPTFNHIDVIINNISNQWFKENNMLDKKNDFFVINSSDFETIKFQNKKIDLRAIQRIIYNTLFNQLSDILDLNNTIKKINTH